MPPKALPRNRRSHQVAPDVIPIYDILADKDKQNAVREVSKKIQALAKSDLEAVEKSVLIFILKICGLDTYVEKMNWRDATQSLNQLLSQMGEENQKNNFANQLYLINQKSKFHQQFISRINNFFDVVFDDQLFLVQQTQLIKKLYEALLAISKCKMRNIRSCSVVLSGIIIKKIKKMYDGLIEKKSSKKGGKLLNVIELNFLQEMIKPRLKDIDSQIRQKAFQIVNNTFWSLQHEIMNVRKLNYFYTQALTQNKPKITQLCLKSIIKLLDVDQHISLNSKKHLEQYASQIIKTLEELVLLPNRNSCLAMEALCSIHTLNPRLNALKPKIIAKIFEIHGYEKFQQGLKKAVYIFFKSLISFNSKEDLNQHRSHLTIQITHLLCSINSVKLLETVLKQFFNAYPALFNFDQMFLLLLTEYYHQNDKDIQLQQKQLNVLCTMICQFNIFLRGTSNSDTKQKQYLSYNMHVLSNCKQIFFEKMVKHREMSYLYLKLFSLLYKPIQGSISNFLAFVYDKTMDIIKQQQYISLSDGNLVVMQQIIDYCASIFQCIFDGHAKQSQVIKSFGITDILDKINVNDMQVIQAAAVISHFQIKELLGPKMFMKLINSYRGSQEKIIKLETIKFAYHSHKWLFVSLFNEPTQQKYQQCIEVRSLLIDFLLNTILQSSNQEPVVKLAAFNTVCRTLTLVSHTKISDISAIYFEPSQKHMETIFSFVGEYVHFNQDQSVGQISMMVSNIGIQSQQIREQILQYIFQVFTLCYRLSLNNYSLQFILKFMLSNSLILKGSSRHLQNFMSQMIKSQISTENNNRFVFWRLFADIITQIPAQDQQNFNVILHKMLNFYFKYGKNKLKQLKNKLMLFVADTIDKNINNSNFNKLNLIKIILNKTYRRFDKDTLHRLLIFFNSKTDKLSQEIINQMRQFLSKISKVGKKTVKKTSHNKEQSQNENESSCSSESENEDEKENQDAKIDYSRTNLRQEREVMVQRRSQQTPKNEARNSRSRTKRKN